MFFGKSFRQCATVSIYSFIDSVFDLSLGIKTGKGGALKHMEQLQLDAVYRKRRDMLHRFINILLGFTGKSDYYVDDNVDVDFSELSDGTVKHVECVAAVYKFCGSFICRLKTELHKNRLDFVYFVKKVQHSFSEAIGAGCY